MAKFAAAIVHSSMQVAPCQPYIGISSSENPIVTSADRRLNRPSISSSPNTSSATLNRMMLA